MCICAYVYVYVCIYVYVYSYTILANHRGHDFSKIVHIFAAAVSVEAVKISVSTFELII